jgi:hypothetical protein
MNTAGSQFFLKDVGFASLSFSICLQLCMSVQQIWIFFCQMIGCFIDSLMPGGKCSILHHRVLSYHLDFGVWESDWSKQSIY